MRIKDKVTAGLIAVIAGLFALSAVAAKEETPSATVEFDKIQVSFIASAQTGGGTLIYKGKKYPFQIGGLGVGGIGVSRISGKGEVYRLKKVEDFQGVYGGLRAGIVVANKALEGGLWMQNTKGVVMRLEPNRKGLALSLGGDGVAIEFDK